MTATHGKEEQKLTGPIFLLAKKSHPVKKSLPTFSVLSAIKLKTNFLILLPHLSSLNPATEKIKITGTLKTEILHNYSPKIDK